MNSLLSNSQVVQWVKNPPEMQETQETRVQSVGQEDPLDSGFSGGSVVKNLPANARDTGSIPGLGRSDMLQNNKARVLQLSLPSRAWEPQILSPCDTSY